MHGTRGERESRGRVQCTVNQCTKERLGASISQEASVRPAGKGNDVAETIQLDVAVRPLPNRKKRVKK